MCRADARSPINHTSSYNYAVVCYHGSSDGKHADYWIFLRPPRNGPRWSSHEFRAYFITARGSTKIHRLSRLPSAPFVRHRVSRQPKFLIILEDFRRYILVGHLGVQITRTSFFNPKSEIAVVPTPSRESNRLREPVMISPWYRLGFPPVTFELIFPFSRMREKGGKRQVERWERERPRDCARLAVVVTLQVIPGGVALTGVGRQWI